MPGFQLQRRWFLGGILLEPPRVVREHGIASTALHYKLRHGLNRMLRRLGGGIRKGGKVVVANALLKRVAPLGSEELWGGGGTLL